MEFKGNMILDLTSKGDFAQIDLVNQISSDDYHIIKGICSVDGKINYVKSASEERLIPELVGSLLCKELGLDAVDYKIATDMHGRLYAMSQIFYEDNCFYTHPSEIILTFLKPFKLSFVDHLDMLNDEMKKSILKLSCVDIKMCQVDRTSRNIMIKKNIETSEVSFAPIYDFGLSYVNFNPSYYTNPYLIVRKNVLSLKSLARKYPEFYGYAKKISSIDMADILGRIEKDHDVKFSDSEIKNYVSKDKEYSKPLKRL